MERQKEGNKGDLSLQFLTKRISFVPEFSDAFSLYDRNNKGKILIRDVSHLCKMLGYNETALCIDDAINLAKTRTGEAGKSMK